MNISERYAWQSVGKQPSPPSKTVVKTTLSSLKDWLLERVGVEKLQ